MPPNAGKYDPQYSVAAAYLYAGGRTDEEVADAIGVRMTDVQHWKKTIPEFQEAARNSSVFVEARLANSVMQAATEGIKLVEIVEVVDETTGKWVPKSRKTKEVPPDSKLAIAYLERRHGWSAKQEVRVEVDTTTQDILAEGRERMRAEIERVQNENRHG